MSLEKPLLLSLTLVLAACGDDGTASTESSTGTTGGTGTTTDDPTTDGPTTPTTGTPTTATDDTTATSTTQGPTTASSSDTTDTTDGTDTTATTTDGLTGSTGSTGTTDGTDTTDGDTSTSTGTTDGDTTGTTTGTDTGDTDTMGVVEDEIYEIQDGTIVAGSMVDVQGVIVTGISPGKTGMFVQEPGGGEHSGVWVYVGKMGPNIMALEVGDEVDITGKTMEFNSLTEIDASLGTVVATGVKGLVVDPELLPIDTFTDPVLAEPWEAVHVGVLGAPLTVTELLGGVEFRLADADGDIIVDDLLYSAILDKVSFPQFGVNASFTAAFGPLNQSGAAYKIAPRSADDLEGYMPPANPQVGVEDLKAGDLVVTEIMYNPSGINDDWEWIEIYNAAATPVDLLGLVIQDNQQNKNAQGKIAVSVVLDPGKYAVLGYKSMVTWPYPTPPAAFYGNNPALGNSGDQVYLKNSTITIDSTPTYITPAGNQGHSFKLSPTKINAVDNDNIANWCFSTVNFYTNAMNISEQGSPGAVNEEACAVL